MLLSALYVRYRDVRPIWEVVLQALFYATPILYPIEAVIGHSETLAKIMLLNPLAALIQESRHLLTGAPSPASVLGSTVLLLVPAGDPRRDDLARREGVRPHGAAGGGGAVGRPLPSVVDRRRWIVPGVARQELHR